MTSTLKVTRRGALRRGAATIAAIAAGGRATAPARRARSAPLGANERIRVGVIGTGVRGKYLIGNLGAPARVTAICDCSRARLAGTLEPRGPFASVLADFREHQAAGCAVHADYRRMLDREPLDAVIIATPDHHHALAALLALDAGLHVYLEKPLSVTVREGRELARMVERTGRTLQVGSQQRSMEMNRFACEFLREGGLGKIRKIELPNYPGPMSVPSLPAQPIPSGLDWDLFLGGTGQRPHHRHLWVKDEFKVGDLLWRGWDLWRPFSGHLMTNWGAHSVDMVQYALGRDDSGPVEIAAWQPDSLDAIWNLWKHKTPAPAADPGGDDNRRFWPVRMRYADGVELHFVHGPDFIRFHGERGVMKMRRNYFETDPPDLVRDGPDPRVERKWRGAGHVARPHLDNWLDCLRSGRPPRAPVEVGHRTATVCHLANIARQVARPLQWDPESEQFLHDEPANQLLDRPRRDGFELP